MNEQTEYHEPISIKYRWYKFLAKFHRYKPSAWLQFQRAGYELDYSGSYGERRELRTWYIVKDDQTVARFPDVTADEGLRLVCEWSERNIGGLF